LTALYQELETVSLPIRSRIAAGAALLDRYFGSRQNWTSRVDWTRHDQTGKDCIINQLFAGNYQAGLASIGAPFRRTGAPFRRTGAPFRRTGDTTQRTGLNHGFSRIRPETSADLTRAWHEFLGITPAPAPAQAPAIDPATEAKRLRRLVADDAVFSGLRNLLDEFDGADDDYDYVVDLLNDRRTDVINEELGKYAAAKTRTDVFAALNAADTRAAVLAY
jgi:hypothetical protein